MDCRAVILLSMAVFLVMLVAYTEGRTKKVVIHVPYRLKKIKHVHTVFKTIHHHHATSDHVGSATDEHEHFHHMHLHDEPVSSAHSQPVPGLSIPEFLPDAPMEMPLNIPDVPQLLPSRHIIPLYRRA